RRRLVDDHELPRDGDPPVDPPAARRPPPCMSRKTSPALGPLAVLSVLREVRTGGEPSAVVEGRVEDVAALVWLGPPDEAQLRAAARGGAPIVAVSES